MMFNSEKAQFQMTLCEHMCFDPHEMLSSPAFGGSALWCCQSCPAPRCGRDILAGALTAHLRGCHAS